MINYYWLILLLIGSLVLCNQKEHFTQNVNIIDQSTFHNVQGKMKAVIVSIDSLAFNFVPHISLRAQTIQQFVSQVNNKANTDFVFLYKVSESVQDQPGLTNISLTIHIYSKKLLFGIDVSFNAEYDKSEGTVTFGDINVVDRSPSDTKINAGILGYDPRYDPQFTTANVISGFNVILTKEEIASELARQRKLRAKREYQCFGSTNPGAKTKEECELSKGIWDTQPRENAECPYYSSNANYQNTRGGLRFGGYCDMPKNTQAVGFRYVSQDPMYQPLCYNCQTNLVSPGTGSTLGRCCDEQRQSLNDSISGKPNFQSPDFAFPGDHLDREHAQNELSAYGLSWK